MMGKLDRFARYAWAVLAVNLGVVLWGAFVRASGSGAGCGRHWPLCNGVVVPRPEHTATLIEFGHRLTSGAALLLVVGLLVWARRARPAGHPARRGAALAMLFMVTEALLGAGLVLFEMVAGNESLARAAWMSAHLVNTFFLLAAVSLTAWWASGAPAVRLRGQRAAGWLLAGAALGMLLLGVSGAVAALGDTLFPVRSLAEGLRQDADPASHLFLRLRVWHPVIAVGVGAYLVIAGNVIAELRPRRPVRLLARALGVVFLLQLGAGLTNLLLRAPIPMQLVHLLLADAVWITLVLFAAAALADASAPTGRAARAAPVAEPARV